MKVKSMILKSILSLVFTLILALSFSVQGVYAQSNPLSLAEVLTGLQAKTGGFSLAEKNEFITGEIKTRGITFPLSSEIENELKRAGANLALINAVRTTTRNTSPTRIINPNAPPIIEFEKTWVDYNAVVGGEKGMRVYSKFTLRNLKDIPLSLTVRIQKEDGDILRSNNSTYRNKGGQLAVFRPIKAGYDNAVYKDYDVFIPYKAFTVDPGKYNLKLDADIIYPDGELLKHLTLYPFLFTQPEKTPTSTNTKSGAILDEMWVDYNVTQNGQKGMLVHTRMTVNGFLNQTIQFALGVEKTDGTKVLARSSSPNRSKVGQLVFYKDLRPQYDSAKFNDIQVFVPYNEIVLPAGNYNLRLHADVLKAGTELDVHLKYYPFTFRSTGSNNNYY